MANVGNSPIARPFPCQQPLRARADGWRSTTTTLAIDETKTPQCPDQASGVLRTLLVEDEPGDVELALRALREAGLEATGDVAQTAEQFTDLVRGMGKSRG